MINRIQPIIGMNQSSCSQPLRSVSCNRRAVTAMLGRQVASENKPDRFQLTVRRAADATTVKSTHHQNSGRDAQPSKSTYLLKQVFIASVKFMLPSAGMVQILVHKISSLRGILSSGRCMDRFYRCSPRV